MRKTLTTTVLTLVMLAPAASAFAATPGSAHPNGSCNNGKGGNGATWNGHGGPATSDSLCDTVAPVSGPPADGTVLTPPPIGART